MTEVRIEKVSLPTGERVPLIAAFGLRIAHSRLQVDETQYDTITQRTLCAMGRDKSKCWDDESRGITLLNSKSDYRTDD